MKVFINTGKEIKSEIFGSRAEITNSQNFSRLKHWYMLDNGVKSLSHNLLL